MTSSSKTLTAVNAVMTQLASQSPTPEPSTDHSGPPLLIKIQVDISKKGFSYWASLAPLMEGPEPTGLHASERRSAALEQKQHAIAEPPDAGLEARAPPS